MKTQARISRTSMIAMLACAVMLLGVFVFPLWVISLKAPQYPQGLGLHIWVDRIEGREAYDLQNINGLNHYIGMQKIEPEAIPELRFMKFFAMGLAATAAIVALARRRWLLVAWVVIAIALSGVGMYDFYKWEYNYGHNLDPAAAIKVPGMTYQPPMFGTKQMLNFQTTAWPGIGGYLAMAGVVLAALCAVRELGLLRLLRRPRSADAPRRSPAHRAATGVALSAALAVSLATGFGCAKEPQAIVYGTDACEHCAMTITNDRYGAVLVTDKGRSHKFDSVECMLQSLMPGEKLDGTGVHSWHVTDYAARGVLTDATASTYLVSPGLPSPMGANLTAFANREEAARVQAEKGGDLMDWTAVGDYIKRWTQS